MDETEQGCEKAGSLVNAANTNTEHENTSESPSTKGRSIDSNSIENWKQRALDQQQGFFSYLGNRRWDAIQLNTNERQILLIKIGFGKFGPPKRIPNETDKNDIGYDLEELKTIQAIADMFMKQHKKYTPESNEIFFSCVFVCIQTSDDQYAVEPVFKTTKDQSPVANLESDIFIDTSCRVYSSWGDYLSNNKLPPCQMCYPENGTYLGNKGKVIVQYGKSPKSKVVGKTLRVLDVTGAVGGLACVAVGCLTLTTLPVSATIIAGASIGGYTIASYSAARSGYALFDRKKHEQSISLFDSESKYHWFGLIGSATGFAKFHTLSKITKLTEAGENISKATRLLYAVASIGCVTLSGVGVADQLITLVDKKKNGTLTALDVFQFTTSLLFLCHDVVNVKTAGTIIQEMQTELIDKHRSGLSGGERKTFKYLKRRVLRKSRGKGVSEMKGMANVIKRLKNIASKKEFYSNIRTPELGTKETLLHFDDDIDNDFNEDVDDDEGDSTDSNESFHTTCSDRSCM